MHPGQRQRRRRTGESFQPFPKRRVEWDSGVERSYFRQHGVMRLAKRRRIGHRLQMTDLGPGVAQRFGRRFEGQKSRLKRQLAELLTGDFINRGLRAVHR